MERRETEPEPRGTERDELRAYLRTHPTVTLWPFAGRALGTSRSLTYALAKSGDIKVLRLGHRCRVSSSWLERVLFTEPEA